MKLTDRTDLSPETIALYQGLEKQRNPGFNPKNPAHCLLFVAVWPAVFFRFPRFFLVLLFSGLLVGATQAWRNPWVQLGLLVTPPAIAFNSTAFSKKRAA
jgi:hypothetical protein